MIAWTALTLVCLLWGVIVSAVVGAWLKARPYVQSLSPLFGAMMPTAAGTVGRTVEPRPAADPDSCEHDWSTPTRYADGVSTHYCKCCGLTQNVTGE